MFYPVFSQLIFNELNVLLSNEFGSVLKFANEHQLELRELVNLVRDISQSKNRKLTIFV